jgi:hypothetical protein
LGVARIVWTAVREMRAQETNCNTVIKGYKLDYYNSYTRTCNSAIAGPKPGSERRRARSNNLG